MRIPARSPTRSRALAALAGGVVLLAVLSWGLLAAGHPAGEPFHVVLPRGASLHEIADSLAHRGVVRWPRGFRGYAQILGVDHRLQAGTYAFRRDEGWSRALRRIVEGDVVTLPVTLAEGATTRLIASRLAPVTGVLPDSIRALLLDTASVTRFGVPGPTLEGYLYPETYRFALGLPLEEVIQELVRSYKRIWTRERRARADSLGFSEREVITLASIIEAEALRVDEMPLISAVYHNRLKRGMLLQADPTIQYALEQRQSRLLYKHIDQVRNSPYSTYHHRGLPPGPIGSPSVEAVDAALRPAEVPYLYFVARPDGSHVFSTTHREHINAKNRIARERRRAAQTRESS